MRSGIKDTAGPRGRGGGGGGAAGRGGGSCCVSRETGDASCKFFNTF